MRRLASAAKIAPWVMALCTLVTPVFGMSLAPDTTFTAATACGQPPSGVYLCVPLAAQQAVTLRSVIQVGKELADMHHEAPLIWLGGLTSLPGTAPNELGLVWNYDQSSWFPAWRLEVRSNTGALRPAPGDGTSHLTAVANIAPEPGHSYETLLSYTEAKGVVSLAVTDLTKGTTVYTGSITVFPLNEAAYVTAGGAGDFSPIALDAVPYYLPVAATVKVGQQGQASFVEFSQIEPSTTPQVQVHAPGWAGPGIFTLRATSQSGQTIELGSVRPEQDDAIFELKPGSLPLGQTNLEISYSEQGKTLLTTTLPVVMGRAASEFALVPMQANPASREGLLHIRVEQPTPTLDIIAHASLSRAVWDAKTREYLYETYPAVPIAEVRLHNLHEGVDYPVPFTLPMPNVQAFWQVVFSAQTVQGVKMTVNGAEQWFTTYAPAKLQPGKPFTIAVLPDTQLYTRNYPDVFTRQTEWIAANAAQRNIGLVLHMGDITDHNEPYEWERASRSLSALDGVVPYVLDIGNHDLVREAWNLDRYATRAHQYFPPARFPALAGVYENGRIDNTYHLLELGSTKYLILSVEYGPRDTVLAWANEIVEAYPDRKVIVVTHNFLTDRGVWATPTSTASVPQASTLAQKPGDVNDAGGIWMKFAMLHPNIMMILSGHMGSPGVPRAWTSGKYGNVVFQLLSDFSGHPNGGDGWMTLYEFLPDDTINVSVFSPYQGQYKDNTDPYGYTTKFAIDLIEGKYKAD